LREESLAKTRSRKVREEKTENGTLNCATRKTRIFADQMKPDFFLAFAAILRGLPASVLPRAQFFYLLGGLCGLAPLREMPFCCFEVV
jgi:hypothetical protein